MMINYGAKIVQTKIVYYGPAMSGKTTSLRALFKHMNKDSDLRSIETTTGRTLFFDFGTLDFKGLEWCIKIYLYSTTGQDFYQTTRPATLEGVDGIVFVVDAQRHLLEYNKYSWFELKNYFKDTLKKIPIIICLNKCDLQDIISEAELRNTFKITKNKDIHIIKSIAIEGKGVKEAFTMVMNKLFPNFKLEL
ncbi:MAG: GTP-binding protein [Promethearchaeota archaeon]